MKRSLLIASAAAATLFAASAAEAARVSWSVGINVPPVATYVSSGPAWAPVPIAYAPGPAVYAAPGQIVVDEPYVDPYVVPRVGFYPPVVVAPRHRIWAPPVRWAPAPRDWDRQGWDRQGGDRRGGDHGGDHGVDRHDRVHHEVDHRR
ncbi:MAG TPA: hypothetical protein VGI48_05640 [Caldimonas sp.]|jgi:hypothetical protein